MIPMLDASQIKGPDSRRIVHELARKYQGQDYFLLSDFPLFKGHHFRYGVPCIHFGQLQHFRFRLELKALIFYWLTCKKITPNSFLTNYYRAFRFFLQFVADNPAINAALVSLNRITPEIEKAYQTYYRQHSKTPTLLNFLFLLYPDFHDHIFCANYFNRLDWKFNELKCYPSDHFQYTDSQGIHFRDIPDKHNRTLLKLYAYYLISTQFLAQSTIFARVQTVKHFLNQLQEEPAEQISTRSLAAYIERKHAEKVKSTTYNTTINILRDFYRFLVRENYCTKTPYLLKAAVKPSITKYDYEGISPDVLQQLFTALPRFPELFRLFILVLYFTGMRSNEACQLSVHSLHQEAGQYYVTYYQKKMRKEVVNPIPRHLYELLAAYRDTRLKDNPSETYLFTSSSGVPWSASGIGQKLTNLCLKNHIQNKDGSPYHFKAHEFRHAYALRLVDQKVPFFTIQQLLHHKSPEMTLIYAQVRENNRKQRYLDFCEAVKPNPNQKVLEPEAKQIDDNIRWLRYAITQTLPNGYCSLPVQLGACPHANACLFCGHFRTTRQFLPVFQYQLVKTKRILALQEKAPEPVKARLKGTVEMLETIINDLQEGKNGKTSATGDR